MSFDVEAYRVPTLLHEPFGPSTKAAEEIQHDGFHTGECIKAG